MLLTALYTYDIYFTNPRVANAYELTVSNEGTGSCTEATDVDNIKINEWEHFHGMVRDVDLQTVVDGGSAEVQVLTMSAGEEVSSGSYFALFYDDVYVAIENITFATKAEEGRSGSKVARQHVCMDWGISATDLASAINHQVADLTGTNVTDQVQVKRSGTAAEVDNFGYSYTIKFTGDEVHGNMQPLVVETDLDTSNPTFDGEGVNDLTITTSRQKLQWPRCAYHHC